MSDYDKWRGEPPVGYSYKCLTKIPLTAELLYNMLRAQGASDYVRVLSALSRGQLISYMAQRYKYEVPELHNDDQGPFAFVSELIREFQRVEVSCSFQDLVGRAWTRFQERKTPTTALSVDDVIAFVTSLCVRGRALMACALADKQVLSYIHHRRGGFGQPRVDRKLHAMAVAWEDYYSAVQNVDSGTVLNTLLRAIKGVYL